MARLHLIGSTHEYGDIHIDKKQGPDLRKQKKAPGGAFCVAWCRGQFMP